MTPHSASLRGVGEIDLTIADALSERPLSWRKEANSWRGVFAMTVRYYAYAVSLSLVGFFAYCAIENKAAAASFLTAILMVLGGSLLFASFDRARYVRRSKRIIDFCIAAIGLLVFSPLLLVVGLIVMLDGGPPLFGHERIGKGGKAFKSWKFRSMSIDADRKLMQFLDRDPSARTDWETQRKLRIDPRLTRIGHFMRATSLDELPQLINVLRGEMSLVGPRAIVRYELSMLNEKEISDYMAVRPGFTGMWRLSRGALDYKIRVQQDLQYVSGMSFRHDLAIIVATIRSGLTRNGW